MRWLPTLLTAIGIAALLVGLLWLGQGLGLVRWPASSFMIGEREWSVRGIVLAVVGVVLILRGRVRRRGA